MFGDVPFSQLVHFVKYRKKITTIDALNDIITYFWQLYIELLDFHIFLQAAVGHPILLT